LAVETFTFLFTDVEGSTALLRRLGEGLCAQVLANHRALIRSGLAAHDGRPGQVPSEERPAADVRHRRRRESTAEHGSRPQAAGEVSAAARAAVADATSAPGRISTIVMAADVSWSPTEVLTPPVPARPPATVAAQRVREIARTGLPDR
jgi:class 3 adenylate cyclase